MKSCGRCAGMRREGRQGCYEKEKPKSFYKVCITTGLGVLMAASAVPVVSMPVYAATQTYQPDYTYSPTGKGGVHISDETASVADDHDQNGNVTGKNAGTDFYVSEWDADPNDPRTECKVWIGYWMKMEIR